jgi:hypothetical protein
LYARAPGEFTSAVCWGGRAGRLFQGGRLRKSLRLLAVATLELAHPFVVAEPFQKPLAGCAVIQVPGKPLLFFRREPLSEVSSQLGFG